MKCAGCNNARTVFLGLADGKKFYFGLLLHKLMAKDETIRFGLFANGCPWSTQGNKPVVNCMR